MDDSLQTNCKSKPWNKGKLIGQKVSLKQREIGQIRANLEHERNVRELAMFDLAIDSKLRACDLMALRVRDVKRGDQITGRSVVLSTQNNTSTPLCDYRSRAASARRLDQARTHLHASIVRALNVRELLRQAGGYAASAAPATSLNSLTAS